MDLPPANDKSALETIENELYDPKKTMEDITLHRVRDAQKDVLPSSWRGDEPLLKEAEKEKGFSFGIKFLLVSSIILLASLSFTAWRVLSSRNVVSSANIDMTADIAPYVEGGIETPLVLTLGNRNTVQLQEATLTLMYKKGLGSQDQEEKINEKRDIGNINANEYKRQDFKVTLYGAEAESRDITVKLEYKVTGSNAIFSKSITKTVVLKTPPISVNIEGPSTLSVGQDGDFKISIKNNTATTSLPSVLQLTLPNSFKLSETNPRPNSRGTVWTIPPIEQGKTTVILVSGSLPGTQGETASIRAQIGSQGDALNSIGVVYSSNSFDINLRSSPITFSLSLDTDRGVTDSLRYGDRATLTIVYVNDSDIPLQDVAFKLSVSGNAALMDKINPNDGYYDSQAGTIVWNKAVINNLATLAPHMQGTLHVSIPIVLQGTNSPELKINITGVGTSQTTDDVVAVLSKSWSVQGSASINANTTYKNSPFKNTGPIPPQPNVDTTYTAHIVVSAQNALVNTRVSFGLPLYVSWLNTTSNNSNILYDARTRTVTWSINKLDAGKTLIADMGVSVRPSQSHINQSPAITSGIVLDADEEVSKVHIRTTISPLTTAIFGESWSTNPSIVVGN